MFLTDVTTTAVEETTTAVEQTSVVSWFSNANQVVADFLGTSTGLAAALMGGAAILLVFGIVVLVRKYRKKAKRGYYN